MKNRADEIRKKYGNLSKSPNGSEKNPLVSRDQPEKSHPLFNRHALIMQVMFSIILFLIVGIIFKNNGEQTAKAQSYIRHVYEDEFHFAAAKDWYEKQFGKPLALLPKDKLLKGTDKEEVREVFASPANGKVYETFKANGKGIWVKTGKDEAVETAKDGYIIFAGKKEGLGYTVVIQHSDEQESWYGDLKEIDKSIKLYNYVDSGTLLGKVSDYEGGKAGKFYFALKKDKSFIDPSKVVPFD
ncbi:M23 family metallopeptidase [Fictibacillus barbaricus]|uniref:Stage IV sporulation protein FA n=1 Tax=Fictibacillus barbaricus TaxID=182136 RepID=A0ABU1U2K4_9BACL|nr:M23 family metallopeptidase [Fictibacillus barbaricus]MDR7073655.1 stage IV sporulation protein FA [Fictibacillus barbaricus]